jgi:periplasmic protein CpxP/Spy
MSKTKLLAIGVIGLLLINISLLAWLFLHKPSVENSEKNSRPNRHMGGGGGDLKYRIIEALQFDAQQQEEYMQLVQQHRATINQIDDSIVVLKNQLYQSLSNSTTQAPNNYITQLGQLQQQIEQTHYQHFADIKALCTKQQLPLYENLIGQMAYFFSQNKKRPPPPRGF